MVQLLQYFALLSHMLEVYPEKVAQLNKDAFAHIAHTLDFGLHGQACFIRHIFFFFLSHSISYFCVGYLLYPVYINNLVILGFLLCRRTLMLLIGV